MKKVLVFSLALMLFFGSFGMMAEAVENKVFENFEG